MEKRKHFKNLTIYLMIIGFSFAFCFNVSADLSDGLVAYYPFNGNANDESGNGNNGAVHGATLTTDRNDIADSAYAFDGVDDYIEIADNASLDITGEITLAAWIKLDTLDNGKGTRQIQGIIDKYYADEDLRAYSLVFNDTEHASDQKVQFVLSSTGTPFTGGVLVSDITLSIDTWYHIVAVFVPDSYMKIYINGNNHTGSITFGAGVPSSIATNDKPVQIGKDSEYDGTLDGKIDDVRIYNRALSEDEIEELYDVGTTTTTTAEDTTTTTTELDTTTTTTISDTSTTTITVEIYTITGRVLNMVDKPIDQCIKLSGQLSAQTYSSKVSGVYQFSDLPRGNYIVEPCEVGRANWEPPRYDIHLTSNRYNLDFRIKSYAYRCPMFYGSNSEEVELLRCFRDNVLKKTPVGREIIKLYYQWSPMIVKMMEEDEEFREEVKEMIDGVLMLITEEE